MAFPADQQTPQQVYDRIELPPIKPDVTRVRLFGGRCACCGVRATASAPAGLEPGSPFGRSIEALVVYLHYAHAVGLDRLAVLMGEVFALSINGGAISNMLARARPSLLAATGAITAAVTASPVVCSDETSARVHGKTWWGRRTIATSRRRETLKSTTLAQYRTDLDLRLDRIVALQPMGKPGRRLRKRIVANRAYLFVFVTARDVPPTHNISERALRPSVRPSVVFRKVTNGFRSRGGAETYAAVRSVVSTAKANGHAVLSALRAALLTKPLPASG